MSAANAQSKKVSGGNTNQATRFQGVTCPFCPLLCDDLVIEQSATGLKVSANACPRAKAVFEKAPATLQPRVNGQPVSLDEAVAAAAGILRKSQQPLFAGLATDVAGMRASVALAESSHAIMDHMHGRATSNNMRVLQSRGWMTTTLTEVRNRADLVVFVGTDASQFHRFYERAIWPDETMFEPKPAKRELIYLGSGLKGKPAGAPKGLKTRQLKCKPEQLGELAGAVNSVLLEQPLRNKVGSIKPAEIRQLAEQLKNAKYSVIIWAPGELPEANGEHIIESVCNLIEKLNETTRSNGFILGGADAGITATNVAAWLTGYPLRINFARGYAEYDPVAYDSETLLADRAVDALLWLSTLDSSKKIPASADRKLPTIVIADSEKCLQREPDVFIPAGVPGIDHGGTLIRADSVVSLPLKQVRDVGRGNAADIIQAIHTQL